MKPDQKKIIQTAEAARKGEAPIIDGPVLETFDPVKLAAALEMECERAKVMGWPKISLHMDVADAKKLARALKKVGR